MSARILTAFLLTFASALVSTAASAQRIDVTLKQDSARFSYIALVGGSTFGRTEMNTGLLYNEDKNVAVDVGLQVIDVAGSKTPGLELGVGPRFYYLSYDATNSDGAAVALGGQLRYKLPSVPRLALMANAFYAPRITSTLDADSMYEIGMGVGYELLPTANIYLAYRRIRADFTMDVGAVNIDSGVSLGMNFTF